MEPVNRTELKARVEKYKNDKTSLKDEVAREIIKSVGMLVIG